MFTGIVTDVGTVESVSPLKEGIRLRKLLPSDESLESVFSYLLEA